MTLEDFKAFSRNHGVCQAKVMRLMNVDLPQVRCTPQERLQLLDSLVTQLIDIADCSPNVRGAAGSSIQN